MIRVPIWLLSEAWRQLSPPHRISACATASGMALVAALESVSIGLIFPLISLLAGGEAPDIFAAAFAFADIPIPSTQTLVLAVLVIFLVKSGVVVAVIRAQAAFLASVARAFGGRALSSHLAAPFERHLQRSGADMTASVVGRLYTVLVFLYEPLFIIAAETLVALAIVAVLLAIEPFYSLLFLAAFSALGLLGNTILHRHAQKAGDAKEVAHRNLLHTYAQTFNAIAEIHTANRSPYFRGLIQDHLERYSSAVGAERFLLYMPRIFIEAGVSIFLFGGLALTLNQAVSGTELVGLIALFAAAAVRLMPSASRILHAVTMIHLAGDAFARLVPDLAPAAQAARRRDSVRRAAFNDRLEVKDVSYRYPSAAHDALEAVSLTIRAGERIVITGHSGSGKTTLLRLLVGLIRPGTGTITIDGEDIGLDIERLRDLIGFVPQEPALFDDTIRANIVFGGDDGGDDRLHRALRQARLDTVVANLPAGTETVLGTNGISLSRGQIQRVAIARALYRDPKILILDEPTATLDTKTGTDVADALEHLDDGVTIIVVSHGASLMRCCTREIEIEGGRIVADKMREIPGGSEETAVGVRAKDKPK